MANPLDYLHGIDVIEVIDANRPIRTARSSVVGLVGSSGKIGTAAKLLLGSRREGQAAFGKRRNDGFTIPQALDGIFDQIGAMVVVINAMPTTNNTSTTEEPEVVTLAPNMGALTRGFVSECVLDELVIAPYVVTVAGQITLPSGCSLMEVRDGVTNAVINPVEGVYNATLLPLGKRVRISYYASLVADTDYTLDAENGTVTRISNGKLLPGASLTVAAYDYVDPTKCGNEDVIGGVDGSGELTGMQGLLAAKSRVFVQPRVIVIPGFTHQKPDAATRNPVVAELLSVLERLKAVAIIDCPNTTREEAVAHRMDFESNRLYFHYPFYKVLAPGTDGTYIDVPASPFIAGVIARTDNDEGFWFSPSNRQVNSIAGISKPIDFSLNDPNCEANYLNSAWVSTTIYESGFRLWGNRVSDGMFLSVRRTADMVEESVMYAHLWAVDRNITRGYVESIVSGVNQYLRHLQAVGAILGGTAWADRELNTPAVLADGHLTIDFEFTAPPPAERITFRAHLVNTYLANVIGLDERVTAGAVNA